MRELLDHQTAGDPSRPSVTYTHRTPRELAEQLDDQAIPVSSKTVQTLMGQMGLRQRPLSKLRVLPEGLDTRDQQFHTLKRHRRQFEVAGEPILSLDSKKQEPIGHVYRAGTLWCDRALEVFDHDSPSYREATMIPHGIYDLAHQQGHLNLSTSADTGQFAVESLLWYWQEYGQDHWPKASRLLLLCDCGGSNSYNSWQWKLHLKQFASETGLVVRVCHYPVYCSKYNPIERRLFSQVHLRWQGQRFETVDQAASSAREVRTETGLWVTSRVWEQTYEAGVRATQEQIEEVLTPREAVLGEYNYVLRP